MKTLSFVIPVYNEETRIDTTLHALLQGVMLRALLMEENLRLEKIIFVDDGSTDNTNLKVKSHKSKVEKALNTQVEIISYNQNRGKGHAVRTGMLASTSDYTLFFDADMSTPLYEIKKFIPQIANGTDVIIGTRKNGHSTVVKHQPLYRELLGRCFTLLSNIILNTWVTDFTCGFKAFSRKAKDEVFGAAKIDRWGYDSEIIFLARKRGYTMQEVPVRWTNDDRTKVNLFTDVPRSFIDLITIRLNHTRLPFYTRRPVPVFTETY